MYNTKMKNNDLTSSLTKLNFNKMVLMMAVMAIMFFTVACPEPIQDGPAERNLEPSDVRVVDDDFIGNISISDEDNYFDVDMQFTIKFRNYNVLTTAHVIDWKILFLNPNNIDNVLYEINMGNFKSLNLSGNEEENYEVKTHGKLYFYTGDFNPNYDIFNGKDPKQIKFILYLKDDFGAEYPTEKIMNLTRFVRQ